MSLGEDKIYSSSDAESQPILQQPSNTPLPKTQFAVVFFLKLAVPIASTQIFPYINAMIEEMHIAPSNQVGFYSGLICCPPTSPGGFNILRVSELAPYDAAY
ncbi:hypothetical protein FRC04_006524 [Tulasnella sp. 424]|nr:hypothetical protein FRC04_006524 [Tulasnella sp. 424]